MRPTGASVRQLGTTKREGKAGTVRAATRFPGEGSAAAEAAERAGYDAGAPTETIDGEAAVAPDDLDEIGGDGILS